MTTTLHVFPILAGATPLTTVDKAEPVPGGDGPNRRKVLAGIAAAVPLTLTEIGRAHV